MKNVTIFYTAIVSLIVTSIFLSGCKKDEIPIVETSMVDNVTGTSATSGGIVHDEGSGTVIERGVCWKKADNKTNIIPTVNDSKTKEAGGEGTFVSNMSNLDAATTYYVRAYATNAAGTGYGDQWEFTTLGQAPTNVTIEATNISSTGATLNGTVNPNYLSTVVSFEYGTTTSYGSIVTATQSPVTGNSITEVSAAITGLTAGTTYHYRVKAVNSFGTTYGDDLTFITLAVSPTVTTTSITNPTQTTASSGGNVTSDGGSAVIEKGICYGTSQNPSIAGLHTTDGFGLGTFISNLTGLTPGTTYYVRAYAKNNIGTSYGTQLVFSTAPASLAILTTNPISSITFTSAKSGGNIQSEGGPIISRGICWATTINPTIANNKTIEPVSTNNFISTILRLTPGTKYYVRAYVTNNVGTSYGNQVSFTTSNYSGTVTDVDGNVYNTVIIGTQVWMAENLKTKKYRNGNIIGTTSFPTQNITNETAPKYQWAWDGNEGNVSTLGRLYTYYVIADSRAVCPTGWHVPTYSEWTTLFDYLTNNGYGYEGSGGDISKSLANGWNVWPASTNLGSIGNDQASNNSSGFNAFQTGRRVFDGRFDYINYCYWWALTESSSTAAYVKSLYYSSSTPTGGSGYDKRNGISVRCVKD